VGRSLIAISLPYVGSGRLGRCDDGGVHLRFRFVREPDVGIAEAAAASPSRYSCLDNAGDAAGERATRSSVRVGEVVFGDDIGDPDPRQVAGVD
jgi:hypothetical protein